MSTSRVEAGGKHCNYTCGPYSVVRDGVTYNTTVKAQYHCKEGWPSWGCSVINDEVLPKVEVNKLSGSWSLGCSNSYFQAYRETGYSSPSTCTGGEYYCEIFRQCVASGEQCNTANPNYVPYNEDMNPSIPARVGPISLRSGGLVPTPPIGNKGYTCRVAWNNAFSSYDTTTTCTFTGPNVNLSFMPSATTSPTFYDANNIKTDSSFKMTCRDGDDGIPQETTTVCRLNWNYKEVN